MFIFITSKIEIENLAYLDQCVFHGNFSTHDYHQAKSRLRLDCYQAGLCDYNLLPEVQLIFLSIWWYDSNRCFKKNKKAVFPLRPLLREIHNQQLSKEKLQLKQSLSVLHSAQTEMQSTFSKSMSFTETHAVKSHIMTQSTVMRSVFEK